MTGDAAGTGPTLAAGPAQVDEMVAGFDTGLAAPAPMVRDTVVVAGPWLSGVTSVIAALREGLPGVVFAEADEFEFGAGFGEQPGEQPVAVVFVVSAVAPMTESDCALLDFAAVGTDLVIGAVSKTDAHHRWREVLEADRAMLAARAPRYAGVEWVGVAAAPELCAPDVDALVEVLRRSLAHDSLSRRNSLRWWESRLSTALERNREEAAGSGHEARASALRQRRDEMLRHRRFAKSDRAIAARGRIQQARVQLAYFARNRCTSLRGELAEDAAAVTRRGIPAFEAYVRDRCTEVTGEVTAGITEHLADVAQELDLPPELVAPPVELVEPPESVPLPLPSRRLETRLSMLLGAGFGLGVALTASRLLAGLAPGLTVAGSVAGGVIGLVVAVWVVGMRALLRDRAALDRWVGEVVGAVRSSLDHLVSTAVLSAETVITAELAARDEAQGADVAGHVAEIDAELRAHAIARARATADAARRLPPLRRALETVRSELDANSPTPGEGSGEGDVG